MEKEKPILAMEGISKTFPGVRALSNVDFTLNQGEIHALMGENGAGKSTLIKVLTGAESLDEGRILLGGGTILPRSPQHAQVLGISTVYQEVNLCPNLSVAENIFIGREPMRFGAISWKEINKRAELLLTKLDLKIDVMLPLDSYSVAIQQMVAIARALDISSKILILDEPTSSLDTNEVEKLFQVMRKLRKDGIGIIFITHFLDQMYEISDRVTILRNGELVGVYDVAALPRIQLVAKMIGKDLDEFDSSIKVRRNIVDKDKPLYIETREFGRKGSIEPFSLSINKGEVLGLAGLLGSGRTETARVFFGIDRADQGEFLVNGKKEVTSAPIDAIKLGMGFCPENRKAEGIISELTVRENIILALQAKKGWNKYITRKEQDRIADKYIKLLSIKTPGKEQIVRNLSGGNQQKVILARWLITNPELLILDEPTRGIDVGTKAEIQKIILELSGSGMAVLFISSELEEMLRCCSRIAVLRDKRIIAELADEEISEGKIMQTIAGEET